MVIVEYEKGLIGAVISKPNLLVDFIGKINPIDFETQIAGNAFSGLVDMFKAEKAIDLVTVVTHLGSSANPAWLADSTSGFTSDRVAKEYANIIREKALQILFKEFDKTNSKCLKFKAFNSKIY